MDNENMPVSVITEVLAGGGERIQVTWVICWVNMLILDASVRVNQRIEYAFKLAPKYADRFTFYEQNQGQSIISKGFRE